MKRKNKKSKVMHHFPLQVVEKFLYVLIKNEITEALGVQKIFKEANEYSGRSLSEVELCRLRLETKAFWDEAGNSENNSLKRHKISYISQNFRQIGQFEKEKFDWRRFQVWRLNRGTEVFLFYEFYYDPQKCVSAAADILRERKREEQT